MNKGATLNWSLAGRTVVLTGATSGIGRELAYQLASLGATLVLVVRNSDAGSATSTEVVVRQPGASVQVVRAQLDDLSSVRSAASAIDRLVGPVDVLVNNAGTFRAKFEQSSDGYEATLAVNHLAPAALTTALLPNLLARRGSRVVNLSSIAHRSASSDVASLLGDWRCAGKYRAMPAYARSKLLNLLWTRELARRTASRGLGVTNLHPGPVRTEIARELPPVLRWAFNMLAKPPERAAAYALRLAADPAMFRTDGAYFEKSHEATPSAAAREPSLAALCWADTAAALRPIGIDPDLAVPDLGASAA